MHTTISPLPTGNLDEATIAAFWAAVRAYDGLSRLDIPHSIDLGGCSGCKRGIVQRVLTAEAQRELLARKPRLSGYAYEPVNGSSHVPAVPGSKIRVWLCPACTVKEAAFRALLATRRRRPPSATAAPKRGASQTVSTVLVAA